MLVVALVLDLAALGILISRRVTHYYKRQEKQPAVAMVKYVRGDNVKVPPFRPVRGPR